MNDQIKQAVDISQKAQRNYDLSKVIPQTDLDTLIYAATNAPSKQNEAHYELKVFTDQNMIENIYNHTKHYALVKRDDTEMKGMFEERDGKFWQNEDRSICNSQILANVLFVYCDYDGEARAGTHRLAKQNKNSESWELYTEQKNYSIGISVGELILSATLLGYKTGICSAFSKKEMQGVIGSEKLPKLLVGIGFKNTELDRRYHAKIKNKDVPPEFRNGDLEHPWRFGIREKETIKVSINGTDS